jgi:MFS family permease
VATIIGSSLTFIDATVVNVALPALQADLRATITDLQWVIEAYALFLGSLILVGGSMGDQFGRRRTFIAGVLLFTLASIACGLATSTRALITARAIQGAGAAFLVPGSLAIISATFDDAERGRAIGTWSGFSAITTAIGPGRRRLADRARQLARHLLPQRAARGHRDCVVAAVHERKSRRHTQ